MNKVNQKTLNKAARFSLAFLWIFTGLTSVYFSPNIGYQILASANITGMLADIAINAGGILDIMLGVWLITSFKIKVCCIVQVSVIVLYTILLTFIDASFWLHPFGPITKNIPIIVLIGYLYASHVNSVQSKPEH
ncbi:DoxX-like family protein [Colwellia sp. RE-S-Sl-9]